MSRIVKPRTMVKAESPGSLVKSLEKSHPLYTWETNYPLDHLIIILKWPTPIPPGL